MPVLPYLNYLWYYRYHIHCLFKLSPEYTNVETLSKETISLKGANRKNIIEDISKMDKPQKYNPLINLYLISNDALAIV